MKGGKSEAYGIASLKVYPITLILFLFTVQQLMTGACLSLKKIEMAASDLKDVTCTEMGDLETLQLGSDSLQTLNIFKCTRYVPLKF